MRRSCTWEKSGGGLADQHPPWGRSATRHQTRLHLQTTYRAYGFTHVTYLTRLFQPLPTPQQGCWNTAFVFLRRGFICKDLHISSRGVQSELQGITRGTVLTRGLVTTGTNTRCECCKNNFSKFSLCENCSGIREHYLQNLFQIL